MERRKFIATVGSLAAGSAAAVGTGAFTSVTASRDVDVEVADDANAYLRLAGTGGNNSDYVTGDGSDGTLEIQLSSDNDDVAGGGTGVNADALTRVDNLFEIKNQGTQEVEVTIDKTGDNSELVKFYPEDEAYDGSAIGSSSGSGVSLGAGDSVTVYVEVDTRDSGLGDEAELLDTVTFNADA